MEHSTMEILFKMLVSLGIVLLVFGGVIYLLKKYTGISGGSLVNKKKKLRDKPIKIIAFQSLGASRNLYLVECMDRTILVGSTASQINLISEIKSGDDSFDSSFAGTLNDRADEAGKDNRRSFNQSLGDIARV